MKKITLFVAVFTLVLQGCYVENPGPQGPRGYDGLNGIDGQDGEEAFVFEYQFDFAHPDYRQLLVLPSTFQMLDSDVVLVYFLWEVTNEGTEVWRQIPQNLFTSEGTLQYNYDFTKFDVSVYMQATFPLQLVTSNFLDNWIARVVVVPGQFSGGRTTAPVDYSDYNAVKSYYGLKDTEISTRDYQKRS